MIRFLLDEIFPPVAAQLLREAGHDAVHVLDLGLRSAEDAAVAAVARAESYVLVTENVAVFAAEPDLVLVFVLKKNLPAADRPTRHRHRPPAAGRREPLPPGR